MNAVIGIVSSHSYSKRDHKNSSKPISPVGVGFDVLNPLLGSGRVTDSILSRESTGKNGRSTVCCQFVPGDNEARFADNFSEAGIVSLAEVVMDRKGGRSRDFAFVTMPSQEEAEKAVNLFNEIDVNSHILRDNITLPKEEKPAPRTSARSNQL